MKTQWQEASGALIYHAKKMVKGKDSANHLRRAKGRLLQLERLIRCDPIPKDEDELNSYITCASIEVYDTIKVGELFFGLQMKKDVGFLTGRRDVYADTVLHCLRAERLIGNIDFERVGAKCKSTYRKLG